MKLHYFLANANNSFNVLPLQGKNEKRITYFRQFPKTINSNSVASLTQLETFKQVYIKGIYNMVYFNEFYDDNSKYVQATGLWDAKVDITPFVPIEHVGTFVLDQKGIFFTT